MKTINGFSLGRDNECVLMIWDINPKTYNQPNRQTNVNSKVEINKGDEIQIADLETRKVFLVVKEIVSKRPSSLSGYEYLELLTDRKTINIQIDENNNKHNN